MNFSVVDLALARRFFEGAVGPWLDEASRLRKPAAKDRFERLVDVVQIVHHPPSLRALQAFVGRHGSRFVDMPEAAIQGLFRGYARDRGFVGALADKPSAALARLELQRFPAWTGKARGAVLMALGSREALWTELSPIEMGRRLADMRPQGGRWVDVGSGSAETLVGLGRRHPQTEVVGIDFADAHPLAKALEEKAPHLRDVPQNLRYLVFGPSEMAIDSPGIEYVEFSAVRMNVILARLGERALTAATRGEALPDDIRFVHECFDAWLREGSYERLGVGTAQVVSVLYTYTSDLTDDLMSPAYHQLETGLSLLAPGGTGILVCEGHDGFARVVSWLGRRPEVARLSFSAWALTGDQLRQAGIVPYRPIFWDSKEAIYEQRGMDPRAHLGTYNWGFVALFEKRAA